MKLLFALFIRNHKIFKMTKSGVFSLFMSALLISFGLSSCSGELRNSGKPTSIGSTAEMLVVTQNEQQWESQIGQSIKKYFAADMYGLPQAEPVFKILHIKADNFSDVFKSERNIFIVNINPKAKEPKIVVERNKWAAPQLIFKITAPTPMSFVKAFKVKKDYLIEKYLAFERQRILKVFKSSLDDKVMKKIKNNFSFTLDIPSGFYVAKTTPTFMWIRHEANLYSQGIMIISIPYKDTTQFSRDKILLRIQNFQLHFIPGPSNDSYMSLDRKFIIPKKTLVTDFPTRYAVEIRGLWRVKNDFMGGPFISYTFLNKNTNRIVTLFGYIYYPNHKKRNLLLQIESILYSVKFNKAGKK